MNMSVLLGYDCAANDPCTTANAGSYLPHANNSTYIYCGTGPVCVELSCPVNTIWDHSTTTCVVDPA